MQLQIMADRSKTTSRGFTLLELMVVLVIMGILATQVVTAFTSPATKVKGAAFNMRSDFNLARAEAVNRNSNILVDFVFDTDLDGDGDADDGYWICLDDDDSSSCEAGDTTIRKVTLPDEVEFYDTDYTGGPAVEPGGGSLTVEDGVDFTADRFAMQPNGTSNKGGTVYIYTPEPDGTGMQVPPYAVVVSPTTGRVRLSIWKTASSTWSTK